MTLGAVHYPLGGSHNGNRIFLGKTPHDISQLPFLQKGQPCRILRTEENIHIGQNGFDACLCFRPRPQISPEIHVKRNQSPLLLEALHHLYSRLPDLRAQGQRNAAGMEAAGRRIQRFVIISHRYLVHRGVFSVVDNTRLPGIRPILIIIYSKSGILFLIIYQIIIADPAEPHPVLDICSQIVCRKLGNNAAAQSQHGRPRGRVQLRASRLLAKPLPPCDALIVRRRQPEHNFSQRQQIKIPLFHHLPSLLPLPESPCSHGICLL